MKPEGYPAAPLPYEEGFWNTSGRPLSPGRLSEVKGFITALPICWTKGENLRILFPTPLIVNLDGNNLKEKSERLSSVMLASTDTKSRG
jgi:phospholipase D1/2